MNYKRIKNGIKITVFKWDDQVILTDIATNTILAIEKFSDHIKAVAIARAL